MATFVLVKRNPTKSVCTLTDETEVQVNSLNLLNVLHFKTCLAFNVRLMMDRVRS